MYDTHVTIVGNALHQPEWRKTASGAMVTTFKIASTARRRSRETGEWVDGNSLRVRVSCWRALAWNVKESVTVGDPLIVTGRLFTRDWVEEGSGTKRTAYELEARSVGHDLSRGRAVFERVKSNISTSATEDPQTEQRVGGEPTEPVPDDQAPAHFDDIPYGAALDRPAPEPAAQSPLDALHEAGFTTEPVDPAGQRDPGAGAEREPVTVGEPEPDSSGPVPVAEGEPDPDAAEPPAGSQAGHRRSFRRRW